jgi:phospholipase/carboxylesterase
MMRELDGPRLEPRGRAASALVVLLHGYGANGDDLIALGEEWRPRLPGAVFVAPNAPQAVPGMPGGLQWFALTMRDPAEFWRGVVAARPLVDRFLDRELARYRLAPDRLVVAGFSQGTMLALHVGLRRASAPAAIVGFSGLLAGPEHLGEMTARPPVLLIHGEVDDLIPADALHIAREPLAQAGLPVEWHVRPGLGHGIDPGGVAIAGHFMAQALGGR